MLYIGVVTQEYLFVYDNVLF